MTKKLEKGLYEVRNETKRLGVYWKFEDKFRAQRHGKTELVETFNTEKECEDFITKGKNVKNSKKIKEVKCKKMSTENYEKPSVQKNSNGKKLGGNSIRSFMGDLILKNTPKAEALSIISDEYRKLGKTDEKWISNRVKCYYNWALKAK